MHPLFLPFPLECGLNSIRYVVSGAIMLNSIRYVVSGAIMRVGLRGGRAGASRAAAGGGNLYGALRCHWNNRKYGDSKLRFPHEKNFSENFLQFGHARTEIFANPRLQGAPNYLPAGAPTCLGPHTGHHGNALERT